jgi:hypothetical protein
MTDFDRAYRALADEADTVHLAPPHDVRARGDRRTRTRIVAAVAATSIAVGGATGGTQWLLRADSGPPVTPGGTPTATLSPTPATPSAPPSTSRPAIRAGVPEESATGRAAPRAIPDSAFLQEGMVEGLLGDAVLPELCGATYKSDAKIQVRRSKHVTYYVKPTEGSTPDGTLNETITAYKSGAAKEFMAQLRSAVANCAKDGDDRYKMVSAPKHGDDSFMFEKRYPTVDPDGHPLGGDDVRLISVVRAGDVVMVLYEMGWEAGWSAEPDVVQNFTKKAVTRLSDWLDRL